MFELRTLKDAERIVRIVMIVILLTAGTSKFFSHGGFFDYYSKLFQQSSLRIHLPALLVNSYLMIIPFIEIGLGLFLFFTRFKHIAVYGWTAFMISLLVGHYILQEWSSVNQLLDYFFLGLLCLLLPSHRSWFHRDKE